MLPRAVIVVMGFLLTATEALAAGMPPARYGKLANGATLIVSPQRNLPIIILQVTLDAGARHDPARKEGLANLTADLLTEGTATRSASEISEAIDFIGGSIESGADTDSASVSISVLKKDLGVGLELLADVLVNPAFAEGEISRRREAILASIRAAEDQPGSVAAKAFDRALFGSEPYGHPVEGSLESVSQLTRSDIHRFYRESYTPARAILSVVGDVDPEAIEVDLGRALAAWQGGEGGAFRYPQPQAAGSRLVTIDKPVTQANIILGHRGVARDHPDYYALTVMNYILGGGGFSSRLLDNIRTRAGLAYSVASYFTVNLSPGSFQIVMQTKSASGRDAIDRTIAEIERIRAEPVSDEEIDEAKRYLTGSFPLRLDSNRKIASFLSQVELYGLGRDYADSYPQRIDAVSKGDVMRVAREYVRPEELILVVVGNLSETPLPPWPPASAGP